MKNRILLILLFTLSILTTYSCFLVYKSMQEQMIFLSEFNSNNFNTPLSKIQSFNHSFPNVSVTTIPLSQMKANYFFKQKKFEIAQKLVQEGYNSNPFLGFGDYLLSKIYKQKGVLDSAQYYALKAIEKLPNNPLHINNFYQVNNSSKIADELFRKYSSFNNPYFWLGYINFSMNNSNISKDKLFELNSYALNNFNREIENFEKIDAFLRLGTNPNNSYQQIVKEALKKIEDKDYNSAIEKFNQAIGLNPSDYSNYENLGIVYYSLKDYTNSIKNINVVLEKFNTNDGKAEMIKGLALIGLGDKILACEYFRSSSKKGMAQSKEFLNNYCDK